MLAIGAFVGLLIGLTGLGSGSLLTPLLILVGGLSPATAVGTSLAFSFTSKFYASWNFYRQRMVQMEIVRDLSIGGLPGALVGAFFIRYLGLRQPGKMDVVLFRAIGAALIVVAFIMIARLLPLAMRPAAVDRTVPVSENVRRALIILAALLSGRAEAAASETLPGTPARQTSG